MSSGQLKLGSKVKILYNLFHGLKISPLMDELNNNEVIELQEFMWERTVEFGLLIRGANFSRKEITRKMMSTSNFQKQQKCSESHYHCKGTYCINSNPECGRKKIKEHVDVMFDSIWDYINKDV